MQAPNVKLLVPNEQSMSTLGRIIIALFTDDKIFGNSIIEVENRFSFPLPGRKALTQISLH